MRRPLMWLGLLATLALLVAACGGEASDDTSSAAAYFEALAAADAVAEAQGEAAVRTLLGQDSTDPEGFATFFDAVEEFNRVLRADLTALSAPADLAAAHNALVAAEEAVIAEIEKVRAAAAEVVTFADIETFVSEAGDAFDEFRRACVALEQLAADRGIDLVLSCAEE